MAWSRCASAEAWAQQESSKISNRTPLTTKDTKVHEGNQSHGFPS
jgi:hypothetical protein